mgnify:FL=1
MSQSVSDTLNPLHSQENRRILAVDDDEELLKQYRNILAHSGGSTASSSGQLIDALKKELGGSDDKVEAVTDRIIYQLDCFLQGEQAVEAVEQSLLEQRSYAVALLDMRILPGIDGLETARQIRKLDEEIQIIFVTAYSDYTVDEIFHQVSGAVLWFRKPFHSGELYQTVRNGCMAWNQVHELKLLKQDLDGRVYKQTEQLQTKMSAVDMLEKKSLKRELRMGEMKRELRSLNAYQDMRLLLREKPQPESERQGPILESKPLNPDLEPVDLLLVDDSSAVRKINKLMLEKIGFRVKVAASVKEAFDHAQKHPPEVALIDFYMPGGNGDQLINLMRSDPRTMHVLSLLFTNAGDELMAVEAGAAYWMTKDDMLLNKMELIRDYVQKNRQFQPSRPDQDLNFENRRVLLADDEQQNLDHLHLVLQGSDSSDVERALLSLGVGDKEGEKPSQLEVPTFELTEVLQGEDAVAAVQEAQLEGRPYAVAMIDIRMPPGIDGLETAKQIRQISPQIEIVIVTAYSDYALSEIRNVLGENFSFLVKPYNHDVVVQRVVEGCKKWKIAHEVNASHHALLNLADDMDQENSLRIEVEKQLMEASRIKDEFLASMSHELRTPLTTIIGNSEYLLEKEYCGGAGCPLKNATETLQAIEGAGRAQLALVNDILDMSKIQSGKFHIDEAPYDLSVLLKDMSRLFSVRAMDAGLEFTIQQNNREAFLLLGDGLRIAQILINLIGNAIKFTESGRVTLTTSVDGEQLIFAVKDSGIGMPPETVAQLFQYFQQADQTISRRFGGSGLGLYISQNLSELMEGYIDVSSEEGVGSTFQLVIPYRLTKISSQQTGERTTQNSVIDDHKLDGHVLVVEDTPELQLLERRILERMGLTVAVANNGKEAVDLATEQPFDLILMDMQMPVMDGIEATRVLRDRGYTVPIVALTANVMQKHRDQFDAVGCDDFMAKPIDKQKLRDTLKKYLG